VRYKDDWERAQGKFREFWARENHDRPLVAVCGRRAEYRPSEAVAPERLIDRWRDPEWLIRRGREWCSSLWFGGEAYPDLWPNLGPDVFAAFLGEELEFGEDTSWARHGLASWKDAPLLRFDPENEWWKTMVDMAEALVADARGDYFVGMTDLHPGMDCLVSLRGPEALCLDLYDESESVKRAVAECRAALFEVYDRLYSTSQGNIGGYSDWMNVWHPGRAFTTSCDFIGLVSGEAREEFVDPELEAELAHFDASIFHLDGPAALRHLDALLELPGLDGVQWVYGAGQPSAAHWLPVLKRILNSGKCAYVSALPSDLSALCAELQPEGLMLQVCPDPGVMGGRAFFTEDEARDILALVERECGMSRRR
jgi:hypothetical protein